MTFDNNMYKFKIVYDPSDPVIMRTITKENGVIIKHSDYLYKNEISVTTNGQTHTITSPNIGFIFISSLFIVLTMLILVKSIINYIYIK